MNVEKLSIVVPIHDESAVLAELVERIEAAAKEAVAADPNMVPDPDPNTGPDPDLDPNQNPGTDTGTDPDPAAFELWLVDDASTDSTAEIAAQWKDRPWFNYLRLSANMGQFRATKHGLLKASNPWVVVLDGDLQDPPEVISALVSRANELHPAPDVVFAVKSRRDDPPWFKAGQAVFHIVQSLLGSLPPPRGSGSFCLMRREVAQRICRIPLCHANLASAAARAAARAAAVGAAGRAWAASVTSADPVDAPFATVAYDKRSRRQGSSRVGLLNLVREALGSFLLSGAGHRLAALLGAASLGAFVPALILSPANPLPCLVLLLSGSAFLIAALGSWAYGQVWLGFLMKESCQPPRPQHAHILQ